jgi:hypothetical protein
MRAIAAAVLALLLGSQAMAEDGSLPALSDPATLKECGACHMAFQPQLLPMRSWQAIMGHLDSHFGEDASLPETTRGAIERYLVAHAGDAPGAAGRRRYLSGIAANAVPLRITETPFWRGAHEEIPVASFASSGVKTRSNCTACHQAAATGQYGEVE